MESISTMANQIMGNFVTIRAERYEELVAAEERLKLLERGFHKLKSYEYDNLSAVMFGKEDEKEC